MGLVWHAKRLIINISGSASVSSSEAESGGSGAKPSMMCTSSISSAV